MTTYQSSINTLTDCGVPPHSAGAPSMLRRILTAWAERAQRRNELRELLDVPEYLLKDMGITREEIYREYRKPFWRK